MPKYCHNRIKRLAATLFILLIHITSNTNAKAQDDIYTIELLIYVNDNGSSSEFWSSHIELGYPDNLIFLSHGENEFMSPLALEARKLNSAADKIARSPGHRIVFHQAWRQRLKPIDNAPSVVIYGGKAHGPHYELEGSAKFSRNRYLHITTDLWLSRFGTQAIGSDQAWPPLPPIPRSNAHRSTSFSDYSSISASQTSRIVKMEEYRRMRSDEIHYLDHPLFGALVTISKYETKAEVNTDNNTENNTDNNPAAKPADEESASKDAREDDIINQNP